MHQQKSQRGGSLFEVLVAVLILGVGILGMAAVQTQALRATRHSFELVQAAGLEQSMLDTMRSRRAQVVAGVYHTGGFVCAGNTGGDLGRWIDDLHAALGGTACGEIACQAGATWCKVTVRWGAPPAQIDDSNVHQLSAGTRL